MFTLTAFFDIIRLDKEGENNDTKRYYRSI